MRSLNIPPQKYSDDSEGHSYGQLVTGSFITTTHLLMHEVWCIVFCKTSNHPGDSISSPYSSDSVPYDFWLFPKLKSPLKVKRFQTVDEIQENMTMQLMVIGRTAWGPKVPTLKETGALLFYVQYFLHLVSSSVNVSIFHIAQLNTFWTDLV